MLCHITGVQWNTQLKFYVWKWQWELWDWTKTAKSSVVTPKQWVDYIWGSVAAINVTFQSRTWSTTTEWSTLPFFFNFLLCNSFLFVSLMPAMLREKKKMAGYYQLFLCAKQGFSDKLLEKKNINWSQIEKYVNGAWFPVESLPPPAPLEGFEGWKWDTVTNFLLWPCSAEMLSPLICLFFEFSQKTLQDLCRRKRWDFTLGISSGMQRHTRNRISQGWQQPGLFS